MASFGCGESYAPPIVDTAGAGVLALSTALLASHRDADIANAAPIDQPSVRHDINVSIGVFATFAAMLGASAIYGYVATGDCHAAREARAVEIARARALPPPYGLAPTGEPPGLWPPAARPTMVPATPAPPSP
jgi:hypothetical protein